MSEYANQSTRGAFIAAVFAMQVRAGDFEVQSEYT